MPPLECNFTESRRSWCPRVCKDKVVLGTSLRKCFWKFSFCKPQGAGHLDHLLGGHLEEGGKNRHGEAESTWEQTSAVALEWKQTAVPALLHTVIVSIHQGLWVCPRARRGFGLVLRVQFTIAKSKWCQRSNTDLSHKSIALWGEMTFAGEKRTQIQSEVQLWALSLFTWSDVRSTI